MTMDTTGMPKLRVGFLGAGMIATVHYGFLVGLDKISDRIELVGIADVVLERAQSVAAAYGFATAVRSLDELLALDLDAIVNLLPGPAHYPASRAILESGRHLVTEKPITNTLAEADELIEIAARRGLLIVTAPADMLTLDWALARDLVRRGAIGKVAFARVQSSHAGAAGLGWPVDPRPFYAPGAGALLDLGVYGITQITGVLGPAIRVMAMSGITVPVRRARGGAFDGIEVPVGAPDNNLVMLDFGASTFAVVDGTFNVVGTKSPRMEMFGLEGTIVLNRDDVDAPPVEVFRLEAAPGLSGWITPKEGWFEEGSDRFKELQRGILVEHLADCLRDGTRPIASAEHARHVLEIMLAADRSSREGVAVELTTTF
jgi:predicted dehydrogenase